MEKLDYTSWTDKALLIEKKKAKKSKLIRSGLIGFCMGIVIFGVVAWLRSEERRFTFFIPLLIPIFFIAGLSKKSKQESGLEEVLKQRGLN